MSAADGDGTPPLVRFRLATGVELVRLIGYSGLYRQGGGLIRKDVPYGATHYQAGAGPWRPVRELPPVWGFVAAGAVPPETDAEAEDAAWAAKHGLAPARSELFE